MCFSVTCHLIVSVGHLRSGSCDGNVYAFGVGGTLLGLDGKTGKVVWERSLGEDFGLLTTHGGRTVSPLIDGDLVIVSGVTFQWGQHARGAHRFMAFDKRTGETVWVSAPAADLTTPHTLHRSS
jgi:outer membrane protein assembly factor BamB